LTWGRLGGSRDLRAVRTPWREGPRGVSPSFSLGSQHHRAIRRQARRYLLAGFAVGSSAPAVEPWAERVPARRVGIAGVVLVLTGLLTQSVQYWVVIFNMRAG